MRILILILISLNILACKQDETTGTIVLSDSCEPQIAVDQFGTEYPNIGVDNNGNEIGYYIGTYISRQWFKAICSNHYFSVNLATGNIDEVNELIFSDSNCTNVIAHKYNYPLHFTGDVYVFGFEGSLYEYPISFVGSVFITDASFYVKTNGGACTLSNNNTGDLRVTRAYSGPAIF